MRSSGTFCCGGVTALVVVVLLLAMPSASLGRVVAPAPPLPTAPSLYGLIQQCLTTMQAMERNWTRLANDTLGRVDSMAQRIVNTEQLILDEGDNIGTMADRIVVTERLVANLTSHCLHCKHAAGVAAPSEHASDSNVSRHDAVPPRRRDAETFQLPSEAALIDTFANAADATDRVAALVRRGEGTDSAGAAAPITDNWMAPFIVFMEHTLVLMEEMNSNVTGAISALEGGIGTMADRIVRTECLIMNMSGQIGSMANRIVATEYTMSNVSAACCHGIHHGAVGRIVGAAPTPPPTFTCPPPPPAQSPLATADALRAIVAGAVERLQTARPLPRDHVGKCNPLDIVCVMLSAMEQCAQAMEDAMMTMAVGVVRDIEQAAGEIGNMADRIVATEGNIINMGMLIGRLADVIVGIERDAEHVGTLMCNMTSSPPSAASDPAAAAAVFPSAARLDTTAAVTTHVLVRPRAAAVNPRLKAAVASLSEAAADGDDSLTRAAAPSKATGGSVGTSLWDFVKLFAKMARAMAGMAADMASVFTTVADTVEGVGDKIDATIGDIGNMSSQIVVMEERIMATASLMTSLVNNCTQP